MKKIYPLAALTLILAIILSGCGRKTDDTLPPTAMPVITVELPTPTTEIRTLRVNTISVLQDTGLLAEIVTAFEEEFDVEVEVFVADARQTLARGEEGEADILLVNAPGLEEDFMDAGHGVRREVFMSSDFIVLGPRSDPADIKGLTSAVEAFRRIAETEATFISGGDEAGSLTKELAVWEAAEIEPQGEWFIQANESMGEVLAMTHEQEAYTLSDRATYLARLQQGLDLEILVEGDPFLTDTFGAIVVNPGKSARIDGNLSNQFIDWLISLPVQETIAGFGGEDQEERIFNPLSPLWIAAHPAPTPTPVVTGGGQGLTITGLVESEMNWTDEEVRAMASITVTTTTQQGENRTYTGVLIAELLEQAEPTAEAATVLFMSDTGYMAEADLEDLAECEECIVAFRPQGGFSIVMPGFPGSLQVINVIKIEVK